MDHKKVDTFAAKDEDGNWIVDGGSVLIPFMAEFNNGYIAGDVSAMNGTFSGVLTANAIDAADRINIAGSSVSVDVYVTKTRYPTSGYLLENTNQTVLTLVINAPESGEGLLSIIGEFNQDDTDDSAYNFYNTLKVTHNTATIYESLWRMQLELASADIDLRLGVALTTGTNTFVFTHYTGSGTTTPFGYYQYLTAAIRLIRK